MQYAQSIRNYSKTIVLDAENGDVTIFMVGALIRPIVYLG